jgi:hypothetical protein
VAGVGIAGGVEVGGVGGLCDEQGETLGGDPRWWGEYRIPVVGVTAV